MIHWAQGALWEAPEHTCKCMTWRGGCKKKEAPLRSRRMIPGEAEMCVCGGQQYRLFSCSLVQSTGAYHLAQDMGRNTKAIGRRQLKVTAVG